MTEVETAREIAAWCERHKDADLAAWVAIVGLFDHGSTETELDWESLVAAANRAMDRRRATALREAGGTPRRAQLELRFGDAWAVRRSLEHSAWRAGYCFNPILQDERKVA